jgi:deoxyribodipyrimidine photolyase-related protein
VDAAVAAYEAGNAPINAVEGFVRQILGWRELIRGIYWTHMPEYAELNALECDDRPVPQFFWDGETDMACVADSMRQLLALGYAHHIHRLMVFGLFAQLYGTHPYDFHRWHMAMYVDAVDWVSLPNTLGMSQFGDGGIVGTKPYVATGKYIDRMGPYCRACRYDPKKAEGEDACPFTTLYWDFLDRHRERFRSNRRMTMQLKNLQRKDDAELERIRRRARGLKAAVSRGDRI